MTNDELWDAEIERLRARVMEAQRVQDVSEDGMHWLEVGNARLAFQDARKARFEGQDYLLWKLSQ